MTRSRRALSSLFLLLALTTNIHAARLRAVQPPATLPARDAFTFSEPEKIRVTHVSLDLEVDFSEKRLRGSATLAVNNISGTTQLVLDTDSLDIFAVRIDDVPTQWSVGAAGFNGAPLTIVVRPYTRSVRIDYRTRPEAAALHWMSAAQSYGRQQPYLYSQNEPTGARSWIPLQDTPSVRVTYDAHLRVDPSLLALMSAENPTSRSPNGEYTFNMPQSVPSYLIALAVGRLEFRALDERTGVYAEPELIDEAAWELQFIPAMVDTAESLLTPYPWKRYDVLLMPPTYLFGGMEHPRLNFINPMSVVSLNHPANPEPSALIAHELAHSWTGDLVTLTTWRDIWLNEGFASYLTLRIIEEMRGADRANLQFFSDRSGYVQYANDIPDKHLTVLHRDFQTGEFPFEAFDTTEYVKGELFVKTLEDLIGRADFDRFLKTYLQLYAFSSADDRAFLSTLDREVLSSRPELESTLKLGEWLYAPGVPANITAPTSSTIYDAILTEADAFRKGKSASQLPLASWPASDINTFISVARSAVESRMSELDAAFGFSARPTPPLQWLVSSIRANYQPGLVAVQRILERGGPNSWMQTLYFNLSKTSSGTTLAKSIFDHARERYDPSVQDYVTKLLYPAAKRAAA